MNKGTLRAICISTERGQLKTPVSEANMIENFGIENDGHAGDWGRQVTCLDYASVERVSKELGKEIHPGEFAENLLIEGIDLAGKIEAGQRIKIGETAVLEVSQIGKEDHPSVVTRTMGVSLLPSEGLFCRVVSGGFIRTGDVVEVI
ncbi:MAG: MOSC domain-containing protein [Syntrophomonadaceae bacterium]|nr:MOSC domain-containing protein [Syntrophomonadaceae bacterium]